MRITIIISVLFFLAAGCNHSSKTNDNNPETDSGTDQLTPTASDDVADTVSGTAADSDAATDSDTATDSDADSDTDTDTDADTDTDTDTDSDTDADTDSDSDTDTDTDADTDSDTHSDSDADVFEKFPQYCTRNIDSNCDGLVDYCNHLVFDSAQRVIELIMDYNCDGQLDDHGTWYYNTQNQNDFQEWEIADEEKVDYCVYFTFESTDHSIAQYDPDCDNSEPFMQSKEFRFDENGKLIESNSDNEADGIWDSCISYVRDENGDIEYEKWDQACDGIDDTFRCRTHAYDSNLNVTGTRITNCDADPIQCIEYKYDCWEWQGDQWVYTE